MIIDSILGPVERLEIKESFCYGIEANRDVNRFESNKIIKAVGYGLYNTQKPKTGDYRYRLDIEIKNNRKDYVDKQLVVLLMNPSNTSPEEGFDPTIQNIIRIAYKMKYKYIVVFNSSPYIDGDSDSQDIKNKKRPKKNTILEANNTQYIVNYIKEHSRDCYDYLVAWGGNEDKITNEQDYLKALYENGLKFINVYKLTSEGKPCHASITVQNCHGYVSDFLNNKTSFEKLEIVHSYTFKNSNITL